MPYIPKILNCEAYLKNAPANGVMLLATFGMSRKNSYNFVFGPVDSKGQAVLDRPRILTEAKAQIDIAIMDYDPIEAGFNGNISVNVMSEDDLRKAIKAFDLFKSIIQYPERYKENLEKAIECPSTRHFQEIEIRIK